VGGLGKCEEFHFFFAFFVMRLARAYFRGAGAQSIIKPYGGVSGRINTIQYMHVLVILKTVRRRTATDLSRTIACP